MIIYNLRNNGPYEFDKFMLNIGQLYNKAEDEKELFAAHEIHSQLKQLENELENLNKDGSWFNMIILLERKNRFL